MTADGRCGEKFDGVQCELCIGHDPEVHVAGRLGEPNRRSWLLGRDHDVHVPDSALPWADGFPRS